MWGSCIWRTFLEWYYIDILYDTQELLLEGLIHILERACRFPSRGWTCTGWRYVWCRFCLLGSLASDRGWRFLRMALRTGFCTLLVRHWERGTWSCRCWASSTFTLCCKISGRSCLTECRTLLSQRSGLQRGAGRNP